LRCKTLAELSVDGGKYGISAPAVNKSESLPTYLRITDIFDDGTLNFSGLKSVNHEKSSKYVLKKNDIVFARTGGSTGRSYFYNENDGKLIYAGFLIKFSIDSRKCNPKFIKYYCQSRQYRDWVNSVNTGSTRGNINAKMYESMPVPNLLRKQQDLLVDTLSCLDDKIAVNKQMNAKLEEMATIIFRNKYLECKAHHDWKKVTLNDVTSKFATGLNPRKNFVLSQGDNFYVTIKNMGDNRIYLNNRCDKITDEAIKIINKRSNLQVGDVLFSGIGTIGRVYLIDKIPKNWNISESIFTIRPNENVSSEFLFMLLLSIEMQEYAHNLASGSVQKGIRMADLKKYPVSLPPRQIMEELTLMLRPLIHLIKQYECESDKLVILRDSLLPRLMSGEISFNQ